MNIIFITNNSANITDTTFVLIAFVENLMFYYTHWKRSRPEKTFCFHLAVL